MVAPQSTLWYVVGEKDSSSFVSWSCGSLDKLENAAVYRSEDNAWKKIKQLYKYSRTSYCDLTVFPIAVQLEA